MVRPSFDLSEFGLELTKIVESIIRNENAILTVSSLLYDFYGVDDICLSVPTIVNRNGVRETLKLPLTDEEIMKLQSCVDAEEHREVADSVERGTVMFQSAVRVL